jgi:hypothetical protein
MRGFEHQISSMNTHLDKILQLIGFHYYPERQNITKDQFPRAEAMHYYSPG